MITENKIKEILKTLPNENSKLDYKLKEYATEKKGDLIKDILALSLIHISEPTRPY